MMCLDTSGSMSKKYPGTEGNLEFYQKFSEYRIQKAIEPNPTRYPSASAFVTMLKTVDRQIEKIATEHPDSIVGITTFS